MFGKGLMFQINNVSLFMVIFMIILSTFFTSAILAEDSWDNTAVFSDTNNPQSYEQHMRCELFRQLTMLLL